MPLRLCYLHCMGGKRRERAATDPEWFFPKRYPHFDQPIRVPTQVRALVESPPRIAARAFLPFIGFSVTTKKFKPEEGRFVPKHRDLKYASHTDSQIFRHYANILSAHYETYIASRGIAECVLAYRKFNPAKCNIHFADEVFRWISASAPCEVLTWDIRDFFESLDHEYLKKRWLTILEAASLPDDHYSVFKAVTRYACVDRDALYEKFGISRQQAKSWMGPICDPHEFRTIVRGGRLIEINESGSGIPQGSAISAVLSNIYMLEVDCEMAALASRVGGIYRRYSDDILIACRPEDRSDFQAALRAQISDAKVQLHDGRGKHCCAVFSRCGDALAAKPPLQYLGFSFDGVKARIRSQTVAKFFRRMRKAARRELFLASLRAESGAPKVVRLRALYRRFTHLGRRSFVAGYASEARRIIARSGIRTQMKRHWRELQHALGRSAASQTAED